MVHLIRLLSRSPSETTEAGRVLGESLSAGDVVALSGELGSGKSVIARGILRSLGVAGDIPSPSFVIVAAYEGRMPVNHIDLYRVNSADEAAGLGLEELLYSEAVSVIEWADKAEDLLPLARIDVMMESAIEPDDRLITVGAVDPRTRRRLMAFARALAGF